MSPIVFSPIILGPLGDVNHMNLKYRCRIKLEINSCGLGYGSSGKDFWSENVLLEIWSVSDVLAG